MKKKLLIIEDNENTRELLMLEFVDEGYHVLGAESALSGLEFLQKNEVDLVMLDLKMPGLDGIEALDKVQALNKQIPIIIHSGYDHFKENSFVHKATDYVLKSANLDPLKKSVDKCLSQKGHPMVAN